MDAEALYGLLEKARERLGISPQERVDDLAKWSFRTYSALINGRKKNPSFELLRDYARVLELDEQAWKAMCIYARGEIPPYDLYENSGREVPAVWKQWVQNTAGHVAYITDRAWNILASNADFDAIYQHLDRPTNMMRWMLLSPDARGTASTLGILTDWDTAWAPYVLPQLRSARARFPSDATLAQLVQDVRADPIAGPMYAERANATVHPDGSERPQRHPIYGDGWVRICAAEPLGSAGARVMGVFFTRGEQPHSRLPHLRAES